MLHPPHHVASVSEYSGLSPTLHAFAKNLRQELHGVKFFCAGELNIRTSI